MRKASIGFATFVLGLVAVFSYAQVPFINQPLVPDAVAPGGPDFTLTVNGTGFVSNSTVNWNGSPLATTFVSGSQLTATVPAADIATGSTASVTVVNSGAANNTSNVVYFPITLPASTVLFTSPLAYATGTSPYAVAAADFNGDGKIDLAVVNNGSNTVSILRGNGDGTFQDQSDYATGTSPQSVAVGDFNGDGVLDLVVGNGNPEGSGSVSVLLGNGDGTFRARTDYATGSRAPQGIAAGDFNGDGNLDLAVANYGPDYEIGTVSILLGKGDGTFGAYVDYSAGENPVGIMAGDFNRDGKLDLAVPNNNGTFGVTILTGNGDGTFRQTAYYNTGINSRVGIVGDLNSDDSLDLAVANWSGNDVSVLMSNGDGTFQQRVNYAAGTTPDALVGADLNGDGKLDAATANRSGDAVSVLLGNGDGTFQTHVDYAAGSVGSSLAAADFNGDGRLDLAVLNNDVNTISILLQPPPGPYVSLSPMTLNFGTQLVLTASTPQTVTLTNTGTATLDITSIVASASFSETNTCGSSLAAGANCTITVTFMPHAPGPLSGAITITDNAADSPQTVALAGIGTVVGLRPSTVSFGTQAVGTTSSAQTVTLLNRASRTVNIYGIGLRGSNPGDFAQTNTCGTSVAPGATCTISVTFTPQAQGPRNATLNVVDNGGGSPQIVTLKGYGT